MSATRTTKLHLAAPQTAGPLAVYPIIGGAPRLRYRSLAQAIKHGAFVTEVDEQGNVNEVLVCNASEEPVLLFEGELIKGARQDRAIDQSVLARPASSWESQPPASSRVAGNTASGRQGLPRPHTRVTLSCVAPGEPRPTDGVRPTQPAPVCKP